ncbi:MAG: serine/threonine-protein kinase [Myxococcota bacterium]
MKRVGRGGMAAVYSAEDPKLDRTVAIKVVLNERGRAADLGRRERMLREARAVASISHPNVVTIYDVGLHDGLVYIAMELVPRSLHSWLTEADRPWRQVLSRFLEAGQGLCAAHDAGLVHRDFKPSNVLLGDDGRPRVADFGLATPASGDSSPDRSQVVDRDTSGEGARDEVTRLTVTGSWVGTPAYVSPEQFASEEVDARSDQFSFCVALYRAVYGQAPFVGKTIAEMQANIARGEPRSPPAKTTVPRWMFRALARGMQPSPRARWPSMATMLRHLDRRRRGGVAVAAMGAASLAALAIVAFGTQGSSPACTGGPDALREIWSAPHRAEVLEAPTPDNPVATRTWAQAEASLSAFSTGWTATYASVCRGGPANAPTEAGDVQRSCLLGQLEALDEVVRTAKAGTPAAIVDASRSARQLPSPSLCADLEYASMHVRPPQDPRAQSKLELVRAELADVRALRQAGRYREAIEVAQPIARLADDLGYAPIRSRAHLELGRLQLHMADGRAAVESLEVAYFAAAESADERMQVEAAVKLIGSNARHLADYAAAERWARLAIAAVEPLGDTPLVADVYEAQANAASGSGKHHEALALHQRALALRERLLSDDDVRIADSHEGLGREYLRTGDYDASAEHLHWALERKRLALGPDHPAVATTLNGLGVLANESGRNGEDVRFYEEALQIVERAYGEDHPRAASLLQNLANATMREPVQANRLMSRALALQEQAFGADNPVLAGLHVAMGNSYRSVNDLDRAEKHYERGLELARIAGAEEPPMVLSQLATLAWARLDFDAARALAERALRQAAVQVDGNPVEVARFRFQLAKLLWDAGADEQRVASILKSARDALETRGQTTFVEAIERWVATRPPHGAHRGP